MNCPNCGSEMGCNRYEDLYVNNPKKDDGSETDHRSYNFYKSKKTIKLCIHYCFECRTIRYHT